MAKRLMIVTAARGSKTGQKQRQKQDTTVCKRSYIVEQLLKRGAFFCKLPDSEVVACGSNQIWAIAFLVWDEHDLGWRVGMLELKLAVRAEFACLIINCKGKRKSSTKAAEVPTAGHC